MAEACAKLILRCGYGPPTMFGYGHSARMDQIIGLALRSPYKLSDLLDAPQEIVGQVSVIRLIYCGHTDTYCRHGVYGDICLAVIDIWS
jgi:hypothetical protein